MTLRIGTMILSALVAIAPGCGSKSQSDGDDIGAGDGGDLAAPALSWSTFEDDVHARALAVAGDGSIYVAGLSGHAWAGDGPTFESLWVGKFSGGGTLLWSKATPLDEDSRAPKDIAAVSDGGFVVVMEDFADSPGGNNVTRYDADGEPVWVAEIDGRPEAIAVGAGDAMVVVGLQTANEHNHVGVVVTLDADGNPGWSQTYGDPNARSSIGAVHIDANGDLLLGGRMGVEPASSRSQAWLHRADAAGAPVWDRLLSDAIATDEVFDVGTATDGTITVVGRSDAPWVKALDSDGEALWTMSPLVDDAAHAIAVAADASFAIAGDEIMSPPEEGCDAAWPGCMWQLVVGRYEPSSAAGWLSVDPTCGSGTDVALTADDRVLVLAQCLTDPDSVRMGLLLYDEP